MATKKTNNKPAKRKAKKQSPVKKFTRGVTGFFKSQKLHQVTGFFLLVLSAYLLIALTSFLFTWQADQDKVVGSWAALLLNSGIVVQNWLGKFGAILSHQFLHNWFGISSFLFVFIFFLLGFRVLFKVSILPLNKAFVFSTFSLIWVSTALSFLFSKSDLLFLGGAFGYYIDQWLVSVLGSVGTGILLGFALLAFFTIAFNLSFAWIGEALKKPQQVETIDDEGFTIVAAKMEAAGNPQLIIDQPESEPTSEILFNPADEPSTDVQLPTIEEIEAEIAAEDEQSEFTFEMTSAPPRERTLSPEEEVKLSIEDIPQADEVLTEDEVELKVNEFGEYDPKLDLARYQLPTIELLTDYGSGSIKINEQELEANKDQIVETLQNYKIEIEKIKATIGPTVTLYELVPAPGIRISKIKNLEDDIALSLSALGIRIIAPMPGKGTIGIEVPNKNPTIVGMRSLIMSEKFQNSKMELPIALGKTIANETFITDLTKMPHLLMAGATGQGKSVGLNAILVSLLYKKHPSQVKFVLVDPKKVELTLYNHLERHFLAKLPDNEEAIATDTKQVVYTLNSLCIEMDQRYELMKTALVRNIKEYNTKFIQRKLNPNKGHRFLPYIVLVVDEFADLIMTAGKEIEGPITRLAQLARAIGIHLIIATQRPSTNIITGTIKANFPTRMAFRVISQIDSRTILDSGGADQLVGRGDMLMSNGSELVRLQCAFVDTPEVDKITEFISSQQGYATAFNLPEYIDESATPGGDVDDSDRDVLFEEAAKIVVQHQQGSASLLQRRLKLGYNRAGRIVDQLEAAGIIGPFEGSKARQVLVTDEFALEQFLTTSGE